MNPSTADGITQFSPCTVGNICSALGRNSVNSSCLVNDRGIVTITGSQCGNGVVESGEDATAVVRKDVGVIPAMMERLASSRTVLFVMI
jgi:hypothetical protein